MYNSELQLILSKLPPDIEVYIHKSRTTILEALNEVYVINEKYIPGGKQDNPDKIVVQYR